MDQLGRREGIFGGALGLPFLVILFLNSYLISVRIEQLVGWEANEIIGTIRIGEWLREISLFDAVGLMISLCDDPEDDAEFKLVRGGRTGIDEAVSEIQSLIAGIQQRKEKKGTNLGGVLAYTKKIARWMAQDRQVLRSRHRPLRKEPHFVVNVFTDGHPDRWQTEDVGEIPVSHLTVWFWGVYTVEPTPLLGVPGRGPPAGTGLCGDGSSGQ